MKVGWFKMADKMMRIAGRSVLGKAKPFKLTEEGELVTFPNDRTFQEVLQDSQDSVSTGKVMDISGRRSVIINVTGDFVANITLVVQLTKGGFRQQLFNLIEAGSGEKIEDGRLTKKGVYVADISGFSTLATRVNEIEEGNVTISVEAVTVPNILIENAKRLELIDAVNKPRNVLLYSGETEVEKGEIKRIGNNLAQDFVMVYAVVKVDVPHDAQLDFSFTTSLDDFSVSSPPIHAFSIKKEGSPLRLCSDWIEVKGDRVSLIVTNNSEVKQNYKIAFFGVR